MSPNWCPYLKVVWKRSLCFILQRNQSADSNHQYNDTYPIKISNLPPSRDKTPNSPLFHHTNRHSPILHNKMHFNTTQQYQQSFNKQNCQQYNLKINPYNATVLSRPQNERSGGKDHRARLTADWRQAAPAWIWHMRKKEGGSILETDKIKAFIGYLFRAWRGVNRFNFLTDFSLSFSRVMK